MIPIKELIPEKTLENPLIGRKVLVLTNQPVIISPFLRRIAKILEMSKENRDRLSFHMSNNTPIKEPFDKEPLKITRPFSAYFSLDGRNGYLITEWGTITSRGETKLHGYLYRHIDYQQRHQQGMMIRSGHLAQLVFDGYQIALLDSLWGNSRVEETEAEFSIITTLLANRILPIGADGFVKFPKQKGG